MTGQEQEPGQEVEMEPEQEAATLPPRDGLEEIDQLYRQGHLVDIDRHFARLVDAMDESGGPEVPLAAALTSAYAREGHVCLALAEIAGTAWPTDAEDAMFLPLLKRWGAEIEQSPAVAGADDSPVNRPLVFDRHGNRLYLARFFQAEDIVTRLLWERSLPVKSQPPVQKTQKALDELFPDIVNTGEARQAAGVAVERRLCVVTGGPGTGKTTIVSNIVALFAMLDIARPARIALAAPTGKAAARLQEAVRERWAKLPATVRGAFKGYEAEASTIHRLLRQARNGLLPYDVLILDEGSMVDLVLMARLLQALPKEARLVILGDAAQLASVQPGSIFADLCRTGIAASPLAPCVVRLTHNWRFDAHSGIGRLANAIAGGNAEAALAALEDASDPTIQMLPLHTPAEFDRLAETFTAERFAPLVSRIRTQGLDALREAEGAGPLAAFRVLCAQRVGAFGAQRFNRVVEQSLRARGLVNASDEFYPGRPIIVTQNDPRVKLANGDTGIVVRNEEGRTVVVFPDLTDEDGQPRLVSPVRLPPHESFFAMTVHRAQGSEYREVAVLPGPEGSRVVSRELLYTAITRARERVTIHGSEKSLRHAIKHATKRSSGLYDALVLEDPPEQDLSG